MSAGKHGALRARPREGERRKAFNGKRCASKGFHKGGFGKGTFGKGYTRQREQEQGHAGRCMGACRCAGWMEQQVCELHGRRALRHQ